MRIEEVMIEEVEETVLFSDGSSTPPPPTADEAAPQATTADAPIPAGKEGVEEEGGNVGSVQESEGEGVGVSGGESGATSGPPSVRCHLIQPWDIRLLLALHIVAIASHTFLRCHSGAENSPSKNSLLPNTDSNSSIWTHRLRVEARASATRLGALMEPWPSSSPRVKASCSCRTPPDRATWRAWPTSPASCTSRVRPLT